MELNINVPTSLSEITLRDYKKFLKIQESANDDRFLNAKIIEIFCGIELKDVMNLKFNDSEKIVSLLSQMFDSKPKLVTQFKLNNKEYGFHPQLDDLTLGEYIDLDTYIGDWDNIEKAMNVLYRPIIAKVKGKYTIDEYKTETVNDILEMPMDAVLSSVFFLWNLGLDLSKTMTNYLDSQENSKDLMDFLNSQKNGGGINQFMDSLQATLQDLKISLN